MIAEVTMGPEISVQNRFIELECEDSDDEDDGPPSMIDEDEESEDKFDCKVCGAKEFDFDEAFAMVRLYDLNALDPEIESAWFQPLNLK